MKRVALIVVLALLPLAGCVSASPKKPVCDPNKTVATIDTLVTYEDEPGFNWKRDGNGWAPPKIRKQFGNGLIDDYDQNNEIDGCEWYFSLKLRRLI